MNSIEITGINPWKLLAALHNASRVSPTPVCRPQARGDITADEALEETCGVVRSEFQDKRHPDAPFWHDYLFGRPIKAFLQREGEKVFLMRTDLYDRDIGEGAAQRVVDSLAQK